ncbi:olfactory receptor 11L1-like [Gastrophryne carolinensis]
MATPQGTQIFMKSNVTEIFLLGFNNIGVFRLPLFIVIFMIYCVTVCGNLLIIALVSYSKTLHTAMYIFLSQLSIADIVLTCDIVPNILKLLNQCISISFSCCLTQYAFFAFTEASECFLLMVMSYDRYLAICLPLHYTSTMTHVLCIKLITSSWILGCCVALIVTLGVCQLQFCGPNTIDHFFCDLSPLMELSCSDTFTLQMQDIVLCILGVVVPFLVIVVSYIQIISDILKISSSSGRQKAFSTCSSHLAVVSMFYGTLTVIYMLPSEGQLELASKALAMVYTVFTPFLNPLIYSLRNKDLKGALRDVVYKSICKY